MNWFVDNDRETVRVKSNVDALLRALDGGDTVGADNDEDVRGEQHVLPIEEQFALLLNGPLR